VGSEVRQEVFDNAIRNCNQVMERWKKRFRLSCPDFANRFQTGLQNVIIHLRPAPNPEEIYLVEYVKETSPSSPLARPVAHDVRCNIQYQPVLTKIIELAQETKSFVAATVRLYALDEFYRVRMDQLFYSPQSGFGTGFAFREREINRSEDILGHTGSMCHDELVGEVVKRPNQVADDIACGAQGVEGDVESVDKARRVLQGLDLSLSPRHISVELIKRDFHISQILFGPLDL